MTKTNQELIHVPSVLVTGANGYIGSHLIRAIDKSQYQVIGLDIGAGLQTEADFQYVGDFGDETLLSRIMAAHNIQTVVHLAAVKSVPESLECPGKYLEINYIHSVRAFQVMSKLGLKKFIFASSAAVYDPLQKYESSGITETGKILPNSPYGISKIASEYFLEVNKKAGLAIVALRIFNVAGIYVRQTQVSGAVNILCDRAINGGQFVLARNQNGVSTLEAIRDYVPIRDVVSGIIAIIANESSPEYGVVNLSTGIGVSLRELIERIEKLSGNSLDIFQGDSTIYEGLCVIGDPTNMSRQYNFTSTNDLNAMIRETLLNIRQK